MLPARMRLPPVPGCELMMPRLVIADVGLPILEAPDPPELFMVTTPCAPVRISDDTFAVELEIGDELSRSVCVPVAPPSCKDASERSALNVTVYVPDTWMHTLSVLSGTRF